MKRTKLCLMHDMWLCFPAWYILVGQHSHTAEDIVLLMNLLDVTAYILSLGMTLFTHMQSWAVRYEILLWIFSHIKLAHENKPSWHVLDHISAKNGWILLQLTPLESSHHASKSHVVLGWDPRVVLVSRGSQRSQSSLFTTADAAEKDPLLLSSTVSGGSA